MTERLRYGIIGSGMMGVEHIMNLAHVPAAVVTAVADPHAGSRDWALATTAHAAETLDREFAPPQLFDDHRSLLAADLCDAVIIASPNMTHAEVLRDCLVAEDLHILVEKPLCTTIAECHDVIERAQDRSGIVWVGLEYRYMPPIAALIGEIEAGVVGRPRMVAIREHRFPFLRKVGDWNRFNRNTGGTLVEKTCHFFDLMNLIIGEAPVRVMASGAQDVNHLDESYDGEVPDIIDNAYVVVEYEGGARAMLDLCMFAEGSTEEQEIAVTGELGKVEAFAPGGEVRVSPRSGEGRRSRVVSGESIPYLGYHNGSSYLEHLDFATTIRSGRTPTVSLADGLMSVAVGVAAQRSIAESRFVTIDEVVDPTR